jgi:hypothetical protein
MREIAHNWISSVRIKVNASRIAAATASAAQSEDRSANQKTTFFDSIGRKQRFKLRHYRKAPAKAIAAAPERPESGNTM